MGHKAAQQADTDREAVHARPERLVMLFGKHRGRTEQRHLAAVCGSPESGTHGHLCLAKAHIAADQPVHGHVLVHVPQDVFYSPGLIRRLLIGEAGLKFMIELVAGSIMVALGHLAVGIHLYEVGSDFFHCLAGTVAAVVPGNRPQPVQRRRGTALCGAEALHKGQPVHWHIEHVMPLVFHEQEVVADTVCFYRLEPQVAADAIVPVDQELALGYVLKGVHALEGTGRDALRLFSLGEQHLFAQDAGIVPDKFCAAPERGYQGIQSWLCGIIAQLAGNAVLLCQFQEALP